jgi:hypothetical protein
LIQVRNAITAAGFLALATLGACGGGKSTTNASTEDAASSSVADDTRTATGAQAAVGAVKQTVNADIGTNGGGSSEPVASRADAGTPPPPPRQDPPPPRPPGVPVAASTDAACVTPGGSQGLTVHTAPDDKLYFSTEYSDKTNENIAGRGYQEGFGPGTADDTGLFHVSWRVPVNAPVGTAIIHYIAQYEAYTIDFTIAAVCP